MAIKNGKASGLSGVVSEMIKAAGEAGVDMITDLVNQIVAEVNIPVEGEYSTILNCYKRKSDSLEKGTTGD